MHSENAYRNSALVARLRSGTGKRHANVFDLDNTLTGPKASQVKAHELINSRGPLIIDTAREPGMVMSSAAFEESREHGYHRAPPRLYKNPDTDTYEYVRPERLDEYAGLLDPAAIIGFGSGILLRQERSRYYLYDQPFTAKLGGLDFRKEMKKRLLGLDFNGDIVTTLSELDADGAYESGKTNVEPLDWRFQFNPCDETQNTDLKFRIANYFREIGLPEYIELVDESRPADDFFCFYVIPKIGTKQASADHVIRTALIEANVSPHEMTVTIADDALTGLRMLDEVLPEATGTYVLPGGAPVAQYLSASSPLYGKPFAGEDLGWLLQRLEQTDKPGIYLRPMPSGAIRKFIIADEAVPGHRSVDSLLALNEQGVLFCAA